MPSDFNAFNSSSFNAFLDSGYNARGARPFTVRYWSAIIDPPTPNASSFFNVSRWKGSAGVFGLSWGVGWLKDGSGSYAIFVVPINNQFNAPLQTIQAPGWLYGQEWNHIVAGYDGENMFLQLNNGARITASVAGIPPSPGGDLRIMGYPGYIAGFAPKVEKSAMDEMSIWDRALSEAEVADDWNAGAGRDYAGTDQEDLIAHWDFDAFSPATDQLTDVHASHVLTWYDFYPSVGTRTIMTGPGIYGTPKIGYSLLMDYYPPNGVFPFNPYVGFYTVASDDFGFG